MSRRKSKSREPEGAGYGIAIFKPLPSINDPSRTKRHKAGFSPPRFGSDVFSEHIPARERVRSYIRSEGPPHVTQNSVNRGGPTPEASQSHNVRARRERSQARPTLGTQRAAIPASQSSSRRPSQARVIATSSNHEPREEIVSEVTEFVGSSSAPAVGSSHRRRSREPSSFSRTMPPYNLARKTVSRSRSPLSSAAKEKSQNNRNTNPSFSNFSFTRGFVKKPQRYGCDSEATTKTPTHLQNTLVSSAAKEMFAKKFPARAGTKVRETRSQSKSVQSAKQPSRSPSTERRSRMRSTVSPFTSPNRQTRMRFSYRVTDEDAPHTPNPGAVVFASAKHKRANALPLTFLNDRRLEDDESDTQTLLDFCYGYIESRSSMR